VLRGIAVDLIMSKHKSRDQAAYNAFAESFIRFNTWIDTQCGVSPSTDRWPYSEFRRPAVTALLKRVDPESPMGVAVESAPKRKTRRRASTKAREVTHEATTLERPVEFISDRVDDLFR
jgi:hypothetical protein